MKLKNSSRDGFSPGFTVDNFLSALVKYFKPSFDLSDDAWDSIRAIDTLCENRFPVPLHTCALFGGRLNVLPAVYNPGSRNELTENLCMTPETVFVAKDPALQQMDGVFLAMATNDRMMPCKWLMRQGTSARLIVGDHRGFRLLAAPLSSFI